MGWPGLGPTRGAWGPSASSPWSTSLRGSLWRTKVPQQRPDCVRLGGPAPAALGGQARRAGGAQGRRRALPAPSPRAARHRPAGPGAAHLAAAPCASSADAERGRLRSRREDVAAARSLCIPRLVRCGVSPRLIAIRSRVVGGEICLKTRDGSQLRSLGRVPVAQDLQFTEKGAHY